MKKPIIYSIEPCNHLVQENNVILKNKNDVIETPPGRIFYLEDLDKKNTWLELNSIIDFERHNLVIIGASKYYKLTSRKVNYLHMLSEKMDSVYIVDYLFACNGLENLFNPISYVSRGLLGYQHWYAWKENYQEKFNGKTLSAFDPELIHYKIKDHVIYDLQRVQRLFVDLYINAKPYEEKRDTLFARRFPVNRLVTTLCDFVTNLSERAVALAQWISSNGFIRPALVFNISGNQKQYKKHINAEFFTYNDTNITNKIVIYIEPILVKEYLMDRIEQLNPQAVYYHINDNTKVSQYLKKHILNHIEGNDALKKCFENEAG